MASETSRVETHEADGIIEIRFRSEKALNLLDETLLAGLVDAARRATRTATTCAPP